MGWRAHGGSAGEALALCRAQMRYWTTVAPCVRRELERWDRRAARIRDPVLRRCATTKLRDERPNTEATATLYTLAPRRHRSDAIVAGVALQVMYDYLDAVHEQPLDDPFASGRCLFRAFVVALSSEAGAEQYYRQCSFGDDGGYLDALVETLRRSLERLPANSAILPTARAAVRRFGEGQIRSHSVPSHGVGQLEAWALARAQSTGLLWWEWAGAAAASVLGVHALLAAAADDVTTSDDARRIDDVYLHCSALATIFDSLVDDVLDDVEGAHRYIAYYVSRRQAESRIVTIVRSTLELSRALPNGAHHAMTVSGIAAFYLSSDRASSPRVRVIATPAIDELRPMITLLIAGLRAWRKVGSGR